MRCPSNSSSTALSESTPRPSRWRARYRNRHRFVRLSQFAEGLTPPRRVRVYKRNGRFLLQWWEPRQRKNVAVRIKGDLLSALSKAREIDERLDNHRDSGAAGSRLNHAELVQEYERDLDRRARAGEITAGTFRRYGSALRHYTAFVSLPDVNRDYPRATKVDRAFALRFAVFLDGRPISPNGHPNAKRRPMRSTTYVLDVARAMFEWAADPDGGALLPEGFRNPFLCRIGRTRAVQVDPTREPDITMAMAAEFLRAADDNAFFLFLPVIFFGLRASEPCFLFREYIRDGWLQVSNLPDLAYMTKGRRDKRFPLTATMARLFAFHLAGRESGLLYVRRTVTGGRADAPLLDASLEELITEFRCRVAAGGGCDATAKTAIRDQVLREAGALTYDDVHVEFQRIVRHLNWPRAATLKDFRHLFATSMANAGMPEPYRKFLMGHSPGRDAIVRYTHLDLIREKYETALLRAYHPLMKAFGERVERLRESAPQRQEQLARRGL